MAQHKNSVYRKISEDISAKIKSGEYAVGSLLAPERKLMETYGVERTTVRRALELLAEEGLILKKAGLGTFVSDGKSIPAYKKEATANESKAVKKQSRTTLPSKIKVKADESAAAALIFDYLVNNNHKRVMSICDSASKYAFISGEAAKRGMYDADTFIITGKNTADDVFVSAWRSLRNPKPTAVIADSDTSAKLILTCAERMRISVPDELSIIVLVKNSSSDFAGCSEDTSIKKRLIKMLGNVADSDLCDACVLAEVSFTEGSTAAAVKNDRIGSGSMSSFLL